MDIHPKQILSLCAGVGGIDLGLQVAEPTARTVCYVEIEAFACELLATRMEDKTLDEAPIWTDLRTFNSKPWRGKVDCITAGYPCQPFSVAGKQRAEKDPRHLWPDVLRVVGEIQPNICFFENVGGHLRLGFEQVHDDLQGLGYSVKAGLFTAAEVGSPHKRERLFILAYRQGNGIAGRLPEQGKVPRTHGAKNAPEPAGSSKAHMANGTGVLSERSHSERNTSKRSKTPLRSKCGGMANSNLTRFQKTRPKLATERAGRKNSELGNSQHDGSPSSTQSRSIKKAHGTRRSKSRSKTPQQLTRANQLGNSQHLRPYAPKKSRRNEKTHGAKRTACRTQSPQQSARTDKLANTNSNRREILPTGELPAKQKSNLHSYPIFPLAPDDLQLWECVQNDLKPSICRMADGMANRVDRIRTCGNGVVPLVAAYAWRTLTTRTEIGEK